MLMADSGVLKIPTGLQWIQTFRHKLDGAGIVGPTLLFDHALASQLVEEALAFRNAGRFTRETPPRCRALQHRSTTVRDCIAKARVVETLSTMASEKLAIHPSMHFGCSFNWSTECMHGDSDPWHLDAAPYTAVAMLSEPEAQFSGGILSLFLGEPSDLWAAVRNKQTPPADLVLDIPFRERGEVVFFQGRHIPHRVTAVLPGKRAADSATPAGRLTLAIGLYSVDQSARWVFPGAPIDKQVVDLCWQNELLKARVLTASEDLRAITAWQSESDRQILFLPDATRRLLACAEQLKDLVELSHPASH